MSFKNFSIWRGRLPHWRADDVRYYVTFRHRRPLDDVERRLLFSALLKPQGKRADFLILCVLPLKTELIFTVGVDPSGNPYELSDIVEKQKRHAGAKIVKRSGERYAPFYSESYDRIIRDDEELGERWEAIFSSPDQLELGDGAGEYGELFVGGEGAPE